MSLGKVGKVRVQVVPNLSLLEHGTTEIPPLLLPGKLAHIKECTYIKYVCVCERDSRCKERGERGNLLAECVFLDQLESLQLRVTLLNEHLQGLRITYAHVL